MNIAYIFKMINWPARACCLRSFVICGVALLFAIPARATDTNAILGAWFAAQGSVHTWSADFVQTRALKTFTQPLTTRGHLDFAAPDSFRWELGQPARTIAVRSDNTMYVVYPRLKQAEQYSLGEGTPKQMRDMISLLQAGFPKNRQEFAAEFQILSLTQTNTSWLLTLQPKSSAVRQMMPELQLGIATNDYSLTSTELVFVDGSRMLSDYANAVKNPPLDPTVFHWTPPADFKVVTPMLK